MTSAFQSSLLTLPDDAFFELIRNYLGPIKTPFNKHTLIARLVSFLRKPETQQAVVARIDNEDATVLSAVWLLDEPTYDELFTFFAADHDFLDMHHHLLNLEDRLLIYRDGDRIRIPPPLKPALESDVFDATWLITGRERQESDPPAGHPWLSDGVLVSLYALAAEQLEFFRADGKLRKRALQEITERIPVLAVAASAPATPDLRGGAARRDEYYQSGVGGMIRARFVAMSLVRCGALRQDGGRLLPLDAMWQQLSSLTAVQRIGVVAAGWAAEDRFSARLAAAVALVAEATPVAVAVEPGSIERILSALADDVSTEECRRAREAMEVCGLFAATGDGRLVVNAGPGKGEAAILIQPNLDVMIPDGVPLRDALIVARLARIGRHDRYPRYELTKTHLASALRAGMTIETVITELRRMCDDTMPSNVETTLRTWAKEFASLRFHDGVILEADEDRRHIIEHAAGVRALISREFAPGIYLVRRSDVAALQAELTSAGVDIVPELPADQSSDSVAVTLRATMGPELADRTARVSQVLAGVNLASKPGLPYRGEWKAPLLETLKNEPISDEQREELAIRVERKLILFDRQLRPDALRTERTEARGLDYTGKVNVVERAIRGHDSLIETIERNADGTPDRKLIEPIELERKGTELFVVGEELPGRNAVRLPVRKLSLVRRIRAGLVKRPPRP